MSMKIATQWWVLFLIVAVFVSGSAFAYDDTRLEMWVKNLKNEKVLIRKNAARALSVLQDKRAIPFLLEALKDPEAQVRAEVCRALGLFGQESLIEELKNVLYADQSPMVRSSAGKAIQNIETYIEIQNEKKIKEMKEKLKTQ